MSDTLNLNQQVYSKSNRTQHQKYMCIINWGNRYYKIGQLLQIGAIFITNWGRYYKLGLLLQIGA